MRVLKYEIPIIDSFTLKLIVGSKILSFKNQNGNACIWALCPDSEEMETRFFFIVGTGEIIDYPVMDCAKFIGTIFIDQFVWHLFEDIT